LDGGKVEPVIDGEPSFFGGGAADPAGGRVAAAEVVEARAGGWWCQAPMRPPRLTKKLVVGPAPISTPFL